MSDEAAKAAMARSLAQKEALEAAEEQESQPVEVPKPTPPGMKKVYLIRDAQTWSSQKETDLPDAENGLSDRGDAEVQYMAETLPSLQIESVLVSPLLGAMQTAAKAMINSELSTTTFRVSPAAREVLDWTRPQHRGRLLEALQSDIDGLPEGFGARFANLEDLETPSDFWNPEKEAGMTQLEVFARFALVCSVALEVGPFSLRLCSGSGIVGGLF